MAGYERVTLEGKRYHVCAVCRRPHSPGYSAPRYVLDERYDHTVKDGIAIAGEDSPKQSLCGECYMKEYAEVYPGAELPYHSSNLLKGATRVELDGTTSVIDQEQVRKDDQKEEARRFAEVSAGKISEQQAYELLFGLEAAPDVEITGPA